MLVPKISFGMNSRFALSLVPCQICQVDDVGNFFLCVGWCIRAQKHVCIGVAGDSFGDYLASFKIFIGFFFPRSLFDHDYRRSWYHVTTVVVFFLLRVSYSWLSISYT